MVPIESVDSVVVMPAALANCANTSESGPDAMSKR